MVIDAMTFLSRLAAQVPPPLVDMLSYCGVLAPAASVRNEIVPGHGEVSRSEQSGCSASQAKGSRTALGSAKIKRVSSARMVWAELIKRVFLEDVLCCPCGGRRRVLSMVSTRGRSCAYCSIWAFLGSDPRLLHLEACRGSLGLRGVEKGW